MTIDKLVDLGSDAFQFGIKECYMFVQGSLDRAVDAAGTEPVCFCKEHVLDARMATHKRLQGTDFRRGRYPTVGRTRLAETRDKGSIDRVGFGAQHGIPAPAGAEPA
jgi:hypothetical protein